MTALTSSRSFKTEAKSVPDGWQNGLHFGELIFGQWGACGALHTAGTVTGSEVATKGSLDQVVGYEYVVYYKHDAVFYRS